MIRFPFRRAPLLAIALAGATLAIGCGIAGPSAVADTFTGTVELGGFVLHTFSVNNEGGEITIKITSISPDSGSSLGMLYGRFATGSSTSCTAIAQTLATEGRTAITNRSEKGTYCLQIYDPLNGFMFRAQTYTVEISHP